MWQHRGKRGEPPSKVKDSCWLLKKLIYWFSVLSRMHNLMLSSFQQEGIKLVHPMNSLYELCTPFSPPSFLPSLPLSLVLSFSFIYTQYIFLGNRPAFSWSSRPSYLYDSISDSLLSQVYLCFFFLFLFWHVFNFLYKKSHHGINHYCGNCYL